MDEMLAVGGGEEGGGGDGGSEGSEGGEGSDGGGYAGTEVGSGPSNSCKANDTVASCNARMEGYKACTAFEAGLTFAGKLTGDLETSKTAAKYGEACRLGVDNKVDVNFRTDMYEKQHSSTGDESFSMYSGDNSSR